MPASEYEPPAMVVTEADRVPRPEPDIAMIAAGIPAAPASLSVSVPFTLEVPVYAKLHFRLAIGASVSVTSCFSVL